MSLRTKIIIKLVSVQMSGWSKGSIQEQRARQERAATFVGLPADIRCQPVEANSVPGAWIEAPDADLGVMLYLHGGAYVLGSINVYREFVARLVHATKMRVLAINYRLAPEHPFPAALQDAVSAYRWLLAQEVDPSRIIIAGDSAGGGLALATLVALRDAGEALPAGAVCISPWTDLALTGPSVQSKASADPILDPGRLELHARYYAREHELTSPLLSPFYADLKDLPPLLIQVGTEEILLDDAVRCADKARESGVDVTLEIWDEMFHVFQMVPFLPETTRAVGQIAEFVSQRLTPGEENIGKE